MSVSAKDLQPDLQGWDGRAKAPLEAILDQYGDRPGLQNALYVLCDAPDCVDAATWCLKRLADKGADLPGFAPVAEAATRAPGWAAKLHVLQIIVQHGALAEPSDLETLSRQAIASKKPMVRAWGYAGLDVFAQRHPDAAPAVAAMLARARQTETAGSVLARLRKCKH